MLLGTHLNAGTDSPAQALESFDGVYDDNAWADEVDEVKRRLTNACESPPPRTSLVGELDAARRRPSMPE